MLSEVRLKKKTAADEVFIWMETAAIALDSSLSHYKVNVVRGRANKQKEVYRAFG